MANHVIIGAGLGGLYLAKRLINLGINPKNIVIIEKRPPNHYTRPGHLNHSVFALVTYKTGIPTPHSNAHHIKELERLIYNDLCGLKVRFVEEKFIAVQAQTDVQAKAVITLKDDNSQNVYPADYVFDCSARNASVANAVNSYLQSMKLTPAFKTSALVDINPIPNHLVAHVKIPSNHRLKYFLAREREVLPPLVEQSSLERRIELRERLKALGWPYEAFPTFYSYSQESKDKVCLYMETPPHLAQSQQEEWINLLLDIYSNGEILNYSELKPSRKYRVKPRIISFESEPYLLNRVIYETPGLPRVIMAFDAFKGFDYRLANGVTSGIDCCEVMLMHIRVVDGSIYSIDSAAIERDTFAYINGKYKRDLENRLTARQGAIDNASAYFSEVYEASITGIPSLAAEKKEQYQFIAGDLAYQAVTIQHPKVETRVRTAVTSLETLNQCLSVLLRAQRMMPAAKTAEHHDVNSKLFSIIREIRLELSAFDIAGNLTDPSISHTRLRSLFESMAQNFQKLDGCVASDFLQGKIRSMLEQISQHIRPMTAPGLSFSPLLLDSPELFSLLLLGFGIGGGATTTGRERFGFFINPVVLASSTSITATRPMM